MEIDVGAEEQTVETVEVVASGEDVPIPARSVGGAGPAGVGLMDQHMIVTSPEGILVPTSEVQTRGGHCLEGITVHSDGLVTVLKADNNFLNVNCKV